MSIDVIRSATVRTFPSLLLIAAVAACGGADADRAPEPGRYEFAAVHPMPGGVPGDSARTAGVLVLDRATAEALSGHWEVDGYARDIGPGGWTGEAYELYAFPYFGGTAVHQIRRGGSPGELACDGHYTMTLSDSVHTVPLRCTIQAADPGQEPSPATAAELDVNSPPVADDTGPVQAPGSPVDPAEEAVAAPGPATASPAAEIPGAAEDSIP